MSTYYFCLNDFDIFALMFAFRSNVDKLLGPGGWNFTCEFVMDSLCGVFNCPRQTHMWSFINLDQVVCLHWTQTLMQNCRSHSGRNSMSWWPICVCNVFNCPGQTQKLRMWVCRGQLKTPHTSIGHHDLLFLPEWLRQLSMTNSHVKVSSTWTK
jgi:hypothetical protein